jgi:hypothetical protein
MKGRVVTSGCYLGAEGARKTVWVSDRPRKANDGLAIIHTPSTWETPEGGRHRLKLR